MLWTKKLDQMHYVGGENSTLCGRPMIGNNYAGHFVPEDGRWVLKDGKDPSYGRPMCPICVEIKEKNDGGQEKEEKGKEEE